MTRRLGKWLHPIWPGEISDIVFIVGCPRSGTTIFGQILSQHPDFLYMHEPLYVWRHLNPQLNVWEGYETRGVLCWGADDVNETERHRLAKWFHLARTLSGQRRLVEKLPLNVFRVHWLSAMFPKAKFIHVVRHGRDVALSLQEAVDRWFSSQRDYPEGYWESSWHYLMFEEYAAAVPELSEALDVVRARGNNYARSLFVWLCSTWQGRQAGQELGNHRLLQVRYEDLIRDPATELREVLTFLEEPLHEDVVRHARTVLHDSSLRKPDPDPEATRAIAGAMLAELGYEVERNLCRPSSIS